MPSMPEAAPAKGIAPAEAGYQDTRPLSRGEARPVSREDARPISRGDARPISRGETRPLSRGDARPISRGDSRPVSRDTTRPVSREDAGRRVLPWAEDERVSYIQSLGIATGPHEELIVKLLEDAVSDVPIPPPWVMYRDEVGRPCWSDQQTQTNCRKHPLDGTMRELAGVCQVCLPLELAARQPCVSNLKLAWEEESKAEINKWYRAQDDQGRDYYWHGESKEVLWEHPGEKVLPMLYMKLKLLDRLRLGDYESPSSRERYNLKSQLTNLEVRLEMQELPRGPGPGDATRKTSGASNFWWGCSPMHYLDPEAEEEAYRSGVADAHQLLDERLATLAGTAEGPAMEGGDVTKLPEEVHGAE